jgi:hypothetical protein
MPGRNLSSKAEQTYGHAEENPKDLDLATRTPRFHADVKPAFYEQKNTTSSCTVAAASALIPDIRKYTDKQQT